MNQMLLGCSMCMFAELDAASPVLVPAVVLLPFVYLVGEYYLAEKPFGAAPIIMTLAMLVLLAFVPPLVGVVLLVFTGGTVVRAWLGGMKQRVRRFGAGVALLLALVVVGSLIRFPGRSETELVVKWQGTGYSRRMVKQFADREDRASLREVVLRAEEWEALNAAKELKKLGLNEDDRSAIRKAAERVSEGTRQSFGEILQAGS